MKTPPAWIIILCLAVANNSWAEEVYRPARYGPAELRIIETIPVVTFAGTPQQLGEQHAALLAAPGKKIFEFPRQIFRDAGLEFFWPLAVSAGEVLMQNAPARYREEIDSAARVAHLDGKTLAVANTLLELHRFGCSTLVVEPKRSETGGMLFGRNFDFPALGLLDRYSVVRVFRPTGKHAFVDVGFPGLMGVVSGMNDAGLCLATLDVLASADGSPRLDADGSPMMLTFRRILEECDSVEDAERLLRETHATTQANLAVCDVHRAAVFEITPWNVARRDADRGVLPCTNHFRSLALSVHETCDRYKRLQKASERETLVLCYSLILG